MSMAPWLSTPETPNQAAAKSGVVGGSATGVAEGGDTQVLSALLTDSLTAATKASIPRYAKFEGPPKARPTTLPDASAMTADVLDPPQSTQR